MSHDFELFCRTDRQRARHGDGPPGGPSATPSGLARLGSCGKAQRLGGQIPTRTAGLGGLGHTITMRPSPALGTFEAIVATMTGPSSAAAILRP